MDYKDYFRTRKIAAVLTVIILVAGSIVYFITDIAERNNEMMYEKIYAENLTDTKTINDTVNKESAESDVVMQNDAKKELL